MGIDKDKGLSKDTANLRRRAEEQLSENRAKHSPPRPVEKTKRLVHELEVNQIELEMQNAELRRAREELEVSLNKYAELYDFAPVGYFTFDARGVIREVNLAGAQLLGIERRQLVNKPFAGFIADAGDREIFSNHLALALQRQVMLRCEISLTRNDGAVFHGQLQSVAVTIESMDGSILTSIVDGTVRKQLEEALQNAHDKLELAVQERTGELSRANVRLSREIEERKGAEESLQSAFAEISHLKDRLGAENIYLRKEVARAYNFGEIIGQSNAMEYVFFRVEQVAPQDATVLLLGETGTGKGMIARAIHGRSSRKDRPMITVNCTALPANLIESELFGREKGAFTGADARQMGRFELADGGTIFLDEIGEMPLELQSKLLRIIQDGEFERLGSPRTIKVDVRIIAASNRNLEEEIRAGRFREDLFYRLNVFPITIPPLRQRKEDIPLLVTYFVAKYNKKIGKKIETVSKETLNALQEYHWPGNVRELESVIERAIITSPGTTLQVLDRFDTFRKAGELAEQDVKALADLEQDHILQVLQKTGWRIEGKNGAAVLLGLNPSTLRARMRKYGIRRH
ncbi:sigma-54 interaction domain-containing protein [Geobacter grbiciae]|uniref:sigma-54 interaction domain-containing protein n=1 Tax=Geobacter grbiciae TaxID=155042 RepID=UPI001C02338F|nr:sigma 54-interacting transcriptional regulator [Geobacter grbiciae]MBT1074720.1 sigma 54-interacting transcriptional regulator [Geobacter grbiciae]